MGKGDKKTNRGKLARGSYGVRRRPKKTSKNLMKARREVPVKIVEPVKVEIKPVARPLIIPKKKLKTTPH